MAAEWKKTNFNNWLDEQVEKLIGDGDLSHLPGAGKPLNLQDDSLTPAEDRLSNKFMKDYDVAPPWMAMGQELTDEHESLLKRMAQYARDYGRRLTEARKTGSAILEREADDRWISACQKIRLDIEKYNSRLLTYNLIVPQGIAHRMTLNIDDELRKAERLIRASS